MKKWMQRSVALLLTAMLILPCCGTETAQAAKKVALSSKKMTIGIGSCGVVDGAYSKTKTRYTLSVKNAVKGASYTFTSSNKKVATVKKSGTKCYITGVKKGTAKVTVKQKLKGKTTTVGSCKVTVKNASLGEVSDSYYCGIGNDVRDLTWLKPIIEIKNINPLAKYTFVCDDSNFTMTQTTKGEGDYHYIEQSYTALKAGTYTVTVKETYKGKTRSLGSVKVTISGLGVPETMTLYEGMEKNIYDVFTGTVGDCEKEYVFKDPTVAEYRETGDAYQIVALKSGTTTMTVYYVGKDGVRGDELGTCEITVKPVSVKDIDIDTSETYEVEEEDYSYARYNIVLDVEEDSGISIYDFGNKFTSQLKVSSSNESVVKAEFVEYDDGSITLYAEGEAGEEADVTISCGTISKTIHVKIVD